MAQLIFIPTQVTVDSKDIQLENNEVIYDLSHTIQRDVEHEFLVTEFPDCDKFFVLYVSSYVNKSQFLWQLSKIRNFNIQKILYYICYNKEMQSFVFFVPEQDVVQLQELLRSINIFCPGPIKIEKIVDDVNQTITFHYPN